MTVDYRAGQVAVGEKSFPFAPYPETLRAILEAGGLLPYLESTAGGAQ